MLQKSAEEFAETSPCGFARYATSDALAYLATGYGIEVAQVFRKGVEEAAGFAKCHCLPFCWWSFHRAWESVEGRDVRPSAEPTGGR